MSHELPPPAIMLQLIMGTWVAQAVGAAARLGLADELADGDRTADQLAAASGSNPDALYRLMRALSSIGVFRMNGTQFGLTALGQTLRRGVPGSMRNIAMAETDTAHWLTWGRFTDSVRTGHMMSREALGMDPWDYYGQHPDLSAQFSRAMQDISAMAIEPVLAGYTFAEHAHVVDVGGAHGTLLGAILQHYPKTRGTLVDLPHVIESARPVYASSPLQGRVTLEPGDFFKAVPESGDVYLLKHILHDWDDEHSVKILRTIRHAMKPSSALLIVELSLPADASPAAAHFMDLNMLVMVSGRERTVDEYRTLLHGAGFELARAIPTQSPMVLLEAKPR
jgi:hypothetical protein